MNPNIDKFPMPDTAPPGAGMHSAELGVSNGVMEQLPPKETASSAPQQMSAIPGPVATNDVPVNPQVNPIPAQTNVHAPGVPVAALAGEELERKWVTVAKTIVERTRDNPYLQSQELSKAGKEYRRQTGRSLDPDKE